MLNYISSTKADLRSSAGVDTSDVDKKTDLATLRSDLIN